jgi:hypothetical protein
MQPVPPIGFSLGEFFLLLCPDLQRGHAWLTFNVLDDGTLLLLLLLLLLVSGLKSFVLLMMLLLWWWNFCNKMKLRLIFCITTTTLEYNCKVRIKP